MKSLITSEKPNCDISKIINAYGFFSPLTHIIPNRNSIGLTIPSLIMVDDIEICPDSLYNLDFNNIESISFLKENASSIFSQNCYGILLITTKNAKQKCTGERWEISVPETGYESFLITQRGKEFYSSQYLKAKNATMVNEWNLRHRQPSLYSSDIYEVSIDYDQNEYYGLNFEYKLYMFFRFMEKEHNMSLINDRLTAKI